MSTIQLCPPGNELRLVPDENDTWAFIEVRLVKNKIKRVILEFIVIDL